MLTPRSTETCPSSGDSSRMMRRKMVDLPAPLGPTSPTFSPRWIAAEASTKRICGPCCLEIWSRRITSIARGVAIAAAESLARGRVEGRDPQRRGHLWYHLLGHESHHLRVGLAIAGQMVGKAQPGQVGV